MKSFPSFVLSTLFIICMGCGDAPNAVIVADEEFLAKERAQLEAADAEMKAISKEQEKVPINQR
ncbi:hypothetical protein [Aporhodopirellula aestuarii]|uniref:Secreted protein n=1 Tax=Aporhodopirellula aestuarii TaxID=2950107 RepID=A0ABT0UD00_9BACT|nr:hypothetical protein [Aporhodopirellula aestuarii]MCM2374908.1 hypothetical protein [Aporhodopirellula aestuarii]